MAQVCKLVGDIKHLVYCSGIDNSLTLHICSSFISVHVIFDDAFELNDDVDKFVPNSFVKQLMECMEDAAR